VGVAGSGLGNANELFDRLGLDRLGEGRLGEDRLGEDGSTEFLGKVSIAAGGSVCARTTDITPPRLILQLKKIKNRNDRHLLL
jgi:hypothetical protein